MSDASDKVFVGCDHAGFTLKREVIARLKEAFRYLVFEDVGCYDEGSVHYPEFAEKVGVRVGNGEGRGILICGSGIGVAIAANKVPGVRAATVWDMTSARLSREHNDANVMCVGSRLVRAEAILDICRTWLTTDFEGGRHQIRVDMIADLDRRFRGGTGTP